MPGGGRFGLIFPTHTTIIGVSPPRVKTFYYDFRRPVRKSIARVTLPTLMRMSYQCRRLSFVYGSIPLKTSGKCWSAADCTLRGGSMYLAVTSCWACRIK